MFTIEFFAWIVVVLSLIKTLIILVNPDKWMKVVEAVWKNSRIVLPVSLILALVVLYNLLKEISIIQVFAVILFIMLIFMASFSRYPNEMLALAKKILKDKNVMKKSSPKTTRLILTICFLRPSCCLKPIGTYSRSIKSYFAIFLLMNFTIQTSLNISSRSYWDKNTKMSLLLEISRKVFIHGEALK